MTGALEVHPVAAMFPPLGDVELRELATSIAREGLLTPCVRQGAVLLDGRNRLAACAMAGVAPRFVEYEGESPVAFILGANLTRRHLTREQRVALAVELEPYFAAEARARQAHGKTAPGRTLRVKVPEAFLLWRSTILPAGSFW